MPPDPGQAGASDSGASLGVLEPILNSPFEMPTEHWLLSIDQPGKKMTGRRPSLAHPPQEGNFAWDLGTTLKSSTTYVPAYEMTLVNLIRERLDDWRSQGYPGVKLKINEFPRIVLSKSRSLNSCRTKRRTGRNTTCRGIYIYCSYITPRTILL